MCVCFGLIWPVLYVFAIHPADHIGGFFKVLFALCALAGGVFALSEGRRTWRIFSTPGDWKARISAGRLKWDAAIPCDNLPIDIELRDIAKALRLETLSTAKDSDGEYTETRERFELHLADDRVLTFDRATSGLNPHLVFLELAKHGIRYELWSQDLTKDSVNTSKMFQSLY
ncbi:hypothetical protein RKLH11_4026 [Rhodobacteraceae bacterium KLH11]|nr:hypothetical protein RKLH11_4026 [Rhodobacteraceae bacterium KLH11]